MNLLALQREQLDAPQTLTDRIFEALRRHVKAGEFSGGTWLREPALVSQFGVSRAPVRQALERLCASGLAERLPYRGVRVISTARRSTQTEVAPVDTRTLAEQVHDRLLTLALTEGYQSQRLTVVKLAKILGVSRTPVRRAVDRLAASGFVVSGRRRGVFFTRIDPERVREVYEVRAELEGLAAQLSASNIEEFVVESLLRENRQLVRGPGAKDRSRLVAQEMRIHQAIAEACGQSYLRKLLQDVFELVRAFQFAGYHAPQMAQRAVREHGLILDAVRRRQGNLARRRMVRHVRNTCRQIMAAVRARSMAHV